ncbi:MAG: alpha/beta hydrolase [Anaerolineae bacterium]|nr:alpha/beta hydrolase [Anaerolineae bacterium]
MLNFLSTTFGLVSAAIGVFIHTPDEDTPLRPVQIAINELSWVSMLLGGLAVVLGIFGGKRTRLGVFSGLIGAGLSASPFMQRRAAATDMESAMKAGFGRYYQRPIPPVMMQRMSQATWSLPNALGARERQSQARLWRDVVFSVPEGKPLKLDIYQPLIAPAVGDKYPAIIVLHGGGWRNGDKGDWFVPNSRYLASQGYVVFDIQYRLSGSAKWPAPFEDVKQAVRWVKECAGEYQVDPERIALLGRSAGAHIGLMAAFVPDADTQVQAVISIYGPTTLQFANLSPASSIVQLMGGTYEQLPEVYANASPVTHVSDGLPPTLLIEGMMDTIVPSRHGDTLVTPLSLTDTPFALLRVPWGRHGFDAATFGLGAQLVQYYVDRFLAWSLYREDKNA